MQERKFVLVKVGDRERPASGEDILDIQEAIEKAFRSDADPIVVSHHAIEIEIYKLPVDEDGKPAVYTTLSSD